MGAEDEPVRSIGSDPEAFTAFYRAHVDEVTRFVTRRVADPQLAADLTAEVFLAVIEAAAGYRGASGGPRTWLFGIARNVIAGEFRRSARERRAEQVIAGRRLLDADDIDRLTARIDASRQVRELHAELRALPDSERAVLVALAGRGSREDWWHAYADVLPEADLDLEGDEHGPLAVGHVVLGQQLAQFLGPDAALAGLDPADLRAVAFEDSGRVFERVARVFPVPAQRASDEPAPHRGISGHGSLPSCGSPGRIRPFVYLKENVALQVVQS